MKIGASVEIVSNMEQAYTIRVARPDQNENNSRRAMPIARYRAMPDTSVGGMPSWRAIERRLISTGVDWEYCKTNRAVLSDVT
jgi:hypothetical protein